MTSRLAANFVLLLAAAIGTPGSAHAQTSAIDGMARAEKGGAPVQFALVRLMNAQSPASDSSTAQGMTNAAGRFRFNDVKPGQYRVQLLRVGFAPVLSEPLEVAAGATVQFTFDVSSQALILPPIIVTAEACMTATELTKHPRISALWQQARDGASVRSELMGRYRYHVLLREESRELTDSGPTPFVTLDQNWVSDPKSARRIAANVRSQRLNRGYYGPNDGWALPNELDVLHEDFLKSHCILSVAARGDGEVGLTFRPMRERRDFLDVRGTIWLDSASYLARRIELEYVDGVDQRGTVRLNFADVDVAGATLRMPVGGAFAIRSSRKNPRKRAEGKVTYTYTDFQELPAASSRLSPRLR